MPKEKPEVFKDMQKYIIKRDGIPMPVQPPYDKDIRWN